MEPVFHAHSPAPADAGQIVLGRYRLGARLGAGGMGVVYRARDEHLERDVAVKRIAIGHDPDGRGEREALAAARLSHAGIVALYESGRDEDAVYLVSELVEGPTLADLLRDGELSDRDVLRIGSTLCAALAHAHKRGVIHRDVKPSNVICPCSDDGVLGTAKLTDFGIARMADHDVLTRTGDIIGTLAYMAPEQARGKKITGAADVYALGVVLYEALTGVNPVRAGNPAATARRVGMRLAPLGRVRRDLPAELCRAIDAAVAVEPEARGKLAALRRALEDSIDAVGDTVGPIAGSALDTIARPALTRTRTRVQRRRDRHDERAERPPRRPRREPPAAARAPRPRALRRRDAGAGPAAARPRLGPWPRVLAAAATALLAAAALSEAGPRPPLEPAAGAALAAAAVLLLPRLGWLLGGRRPAHLAGRHRPRRGAARRGRARPGPRPARPPRAGVVAARRRPAAGDRRPGRRLARARRAGRALAGARRARRARRLVARARRDADRRPARVRRAARRARAQRVGRLGLRGHAARARAARGRRRARARRAVGAGGGAAAGARARALGGARPRRRRRVGRRAGRRHAGRVRGARARSRRAGSSSARCSAP